MFAGLTLAGASHDKQTQDSVIGYLRTISVSSSKLLLAAKSLSADPNAPNAMNQLTAAARCVCTVKRVPICRYVHAACNIVITAGLLLIQSMNS